MNLILMMAAKKSQEEQRKENYIFTLTAPVPFYLLLK